MIWASKEGEKIEASPEMVAICPTCQGDVISKCGTIKIWHWAHKSNKDCDDWSEPESEWHKNWKNCFPKQQQEVVMKGSDGKQHRADVLNMNGVVIEFQNIHISNIDIQEREKFYTIGGNMIWVLNGKELCKGLNIFYKVLSNDRHKITFRWKNPPKSWWSASKDVYIDMGDSIRTLQRRYDRGVCECSDTISNNKTILHISKIYKTIPCAGFGELLYKQDFLTKYRVDL